MLKYQSGPWPLVLIAQDQSRNIATPPKDNLRRDVHQSGRFRHKAKPASTCCTQVLAGSVCGSRLLLKRFSVGLQQEPVFDEHHAAGKYLPAPRHKQVLARSVVRQTYRETL
jgi:hypothetical protein